MNKTLRDIETPYFLPYQVAWLKDDSRIKIWEKCRRAGATYVQSYEDVRDIAGKKEYIPGRPIRKVYFTSADESAAKEYIDYCAEWAAVLNVAAEMIGEVILDKKNGVSALCVKFANGGKIYALTSNPKRFRSKGGKIVWDEAAHHEDQKAMWKAAKPASMWGYPIRIMSTHNGCDSLFYEFVDDTKTGETGWSRHFVDIFAAVDQGLLDKIMGRATTNAERAAWIEQEHRDCRDENIWLEEYCCIAQSNKQALLPFELIAACEEKNILWNVRTSAENFLIRGHFEGSKLEGPENPKSAWAFDMLDEFRSYLMSMPVCGPRYSGMDIARKKHLSAICTLEAIGSMKITRQMLILEICPFWFQELVLYTVMSIQSHYRTCIDATGLGMQLAENAVLKFGKLRAEAITMTTPVKAELAEGMRIAFDDRKIATPPDKIIRADYHSVKKTTTSAGYNRYDGTDSEDGHADRFWATGLALHAGSDAADPIYIATRRRRTTHEVCQNY